MQLVLLPGTQYSNGQAFDIPNVVIEAHKVGAYAGFDLAAVVGDMELSLHDWNVDFAVWAHYKYLNGGLGSVGGAFIHRNIFRTLEQLIEYFTMEYWNIYCCNINFMINAVNEN